MTAEQEILALTWRSDKLGDGIQLDPECKSVSRHSKTGWGVQLADLWLTKDITTVAIECSELTADAYIGVVGRNYNPSDWTGNLSESTHAVVVHAGTGRVSYKGGSTNFVLKPLVSGARLMLTMDLQQRLLTVELVSAADTTRVESKIDIEGIPAELAVAVCFGPGEQRVRLAGCESHKPDCTLLGKVNKDLWDEENVVPPMALNVRSDDSVMGQMRKLQESTTAVAEGLS